MVHPKVLFLTSFDSSTAKSWSGTPLNMKNALIENGFQVEELGKIGNFSKTLIRACSFIFKKLSSKRLDASHSLLASLEYSIRIYFKIRGEKYDYIVAPAGSNLIAFLRTSIPIIYLSDTTFGQISTYYNDFSDLTKLSLNIGNFLEKKALNKATYISFPSDWAKDYVIQNYKISPEKVSKINWGPNSDLQKVREPVVKKFDDTFKVLFLGVDWVRKGGGTVLSTLNLLNNEGYKVELHICGCFPSVSVKDLSWVYCYGRLNKDIPEEKKLLEKLMHESHLMFVPSQAECYGMVFCEAAAYSIPSISTRTGGIPSIIDDGVNGYLLDKSATEAEFFSLIEQLLLNKTKYDELSKAARLLYDEKCNWSVWANTLKLKVGCND